MYKRQYTEEDYKMLCEWWGAWGWQAIPEMFLPATGIVIGDDKGDICAVFLYKTDSAIIWAENYISSKEARGKRRKDAMQMLISEAKKQAREMGYKVVMSAVKHDGLASKLKNNGFVLADTKLDNYVGVV